ncbi:MAG: DNA recombination protein RmuC, partial [Spirochaetales bacterium]|nr:DNA recombination protein RmuC [Spirochaetales bacterium]
ARVEFAIKLPGKDENEVYLPIDSKFPKEDYERYIEANSQGDVDGMQQSLKALRLRIGLEAKDIAEKYINPPFTTDFAILFVPTESLYAEVLNMGGFVEELQNKFRVVVSGPTTFAALVNSLQMGFKTLAIEKRSAKVWSLFAQMRKQFTMFSRELEAAEKSLSTATNRLTSVSSRSIKISERLSALEGSEEAEEEVLQIEEINE